MSSSPQRRHTSTTVARNDVHDKHESRPTERLQADVGNLMKTLVCSTACSVRPRDARVVEAEEAMLLSMPRSWSSFGSVLIRRLEASLPAAPSDLILLEGGAPSKFMMSEAAFSKGFIRASVFASMSSSSSVGLAPMNSPLSSNNAESESSS